MPATPVPYPVFAVGDLHGRPRWLDRLLANLRAHPLWPAARVVSSATSWTAATT